MPNGLSYADAAKLLGGGQSKIVTALDKLTGGVLLAATGGGSELAVSLFDAKSELARLSGELVSGLSRKLGGATRMRRGELLAASHAVIVVTAFFEALREVELPFDTKDITTKDQVTLATGEYGRELATSLVRSGIPIPTPDLPYERVLAELTGYYRELGQAVSSFVAGLAVWDRLDDRARATVVTRIKGKAPDLALVRYEDSFRRLAAEFPEVAFWSNLVEHQATRAQIQQLRIGLAGLAETLADIAAGNAASGVRLTLARAYEARLRRPLLDGDANGLRFPNVEEAYVTPGFRVTEGMPAEMVANENWWNDLPRRDDLQGFLVGHMTSPRSTEAPLVVLGQPGSGKSLLTQMLAARLPASDFLTVRVALREVPADADLQEQIEQSVRAATGEKVSWPDLVRTADQALAVVLIDGFDELLQATGLSQANYLERVVAFQRREAELGRPVVVVVTSRTSVADRVRPVDGMVTVRLEPFDDSQIAQWLAVWSQVNSGPLKDRDLTPLPAEVAIDHAQLARQPLLLMMLALYDADANALQRHGDPLDEIRLYERLLTQFARRELAKESPGEVTDQAVEQELLRLAIVAFAMFNRNRLWVAESELDADLAALLGDQPPTTAEQLVGRFYFVHVAQANQDSRRLRTFEFLHATFGEYLIARQVVRELVDLSEASAGHGRPRLVEDYFLHALLSFAPLTMRGTVFWFTCDLIDALPADRLTRIRDLTLRLFHEALLPRKTTSLNDYSPMNAEAPLRYAAYSANLFLLTAMTEDEVTTAELFPGKEKPIDEWSRIATLWRSQLPTEGVQVMVDVLVLERDWAGRDRLLRLRIQASDDWWLPDPHWTYDHHPDSSSRTSDVHVWLSDDHRWIRDEFSFLCSRDSDVLVHALEPLLGELGSLVTTFHRSADRPPISAANALITLWLAASRGDKAALFEAHETCLEMVINGSAPWDKDTLRKFRALYVHQLEVDRMRLPNGWFDTALNRMRRGS